MSSPLDLFVSMETDPRMEVVRRHIEEIDRNVQQLSILLRDLQSSSPSRAVAVDSLVQMLQPVIQSYHHWAEDNRTSPRVSTQDSEMSSPPDTDDAGAHDDGNGRLSSGHPPDPSAGTPPSPPPGLGIATPSPMPPPAPPGSGRGDTDPSNEPEQIARSLEWVPERFRDIHAGLHVDAMQHCNINPGASRFHSGWTVVRHLLEPAYNTATPTSALSLKQALWGSEEVRLSTQPVSSDNPSENTRQLQKLQVSRGLRAIYYRFRLIKLLDYRDVCADSLNLTSGQQKKKFAHQHILEEAFGPEHVGANNINWLKERLKEAKPWRMLVKRFGHAIIFLIDPKFGHSLRWVAKRDMERGIDLMEKAQPTLWACTQNAQNLYDDLFAGRALEDRPIMTTDDQVILGQQGDLESYTWLFK